MALDFDDIASPLDLQAIADTTPILKTLAQQNGIFDRTRRAWVAPASLPFGQGALILELQRDNIPADLALTLVYEEDYAADFIVQLWDARNQILADDLFSNIIVAGQEARTDTFILDLARHPTATRIVLRRLTGEIQLYGLLLSSVACELPQTQCGTYELALQLDSEITPESPLVQATEQLVPNPEAPTDWGSRILQQPVDVTENNPFAKIALADETYPPYVPSRATLSGDFRPRFTASALLAVYRILRVLNANHPAVHGYAIDSLSSMDSLRFLLAGETHAAMMSIPMSLADRERFFRSRGYPVMELPVAMDPIVVVVNDRNPLRELTLPQVDAIFGTELRAGAEAPIRTWGDLGLSGEWAKAPIVLWGGFQKTGTAQLFQKRVLQGGPYRPALQNDPIQMYAGVLRHVSHDPHAIGFCNAQHFFPGNHSLALAPQTGHPAHPPTPEAVYADAYPLTRYLYLYLDAPSPAELDPLMREFLNILYSRRGQECFARGRQAPLTAAKVREIRARLGL